MLKALKIILVVLSIIVALLIGAAFAMSSDKPEFVTPTPAPTATAPAQNKADVVPPPGEIKKPVTKATPVTIGEGVWEVGTDVKAGRYRLNVSPDKDSVCYWKISRDAEGDDIISNDLPIGGHPQVTIKKGQFFTTTNCPAWVLVK